MKRFAHFILTLSVNSLVVLSQDKPRFSIGLGVLAPSYSQKFAGNGRLDFDQDKNGFSYSLNNVPHGTSGSTTSYQSQSNPQSYGSAPTHSSGSDYSSLQSSPQSPPSGQFSIYQHRSISPKQSANTFNNPPDDDNNPPQRSYLSSQSSGSQFESQPNIERQYNTPAVVSSGQSFNEPEDHSGDYREDHSGDYREDNSGLYNQNDEQRSPIGSVQSVQSDQHQNQPQFGNYNFEQQITHQIQDSQPFQSHGQSQPGLSYRSEPSQTQTYQSQPSHPTYQSQPSHQRAIRLESQPIQSQQRFQFRPQSVYALRV